MKKTSKLLALSLFLSSLLIPEKGNSEVFGIIGGVSSTPGGVPYLALVNSDAEATAVTGEIPNTGFIRGVAMNEYGYGLAVGNQPSGIGGYAAFVSPDAVATQITGSYPPPSNGIITGASINNSRYAIIGGRDNGNNLGYAALVSPDGETTAISGFTANNANIFTVDINESRQGIVGGIDNLNPYAILVSPAGVASSLTGSELPTGSGQISSVAINNSGYAIIGGKDNESGGNYDPFVALVSPAGETSALSGDTPTGLGEIVSVDINDSRQSIIGGGTTTNGFYVALVSPDGNATAIFGDGVPGITSDLRSVAINSTGAGIAGGYDENSAPYATIISPSGEATRLTGEVPVAVGEIASVSISDSGIGLIGGYEKSGTNPNEQSTYQALIAPNGYATKLTGDILPIPDTGEVLAVAIKEAISEMVDPNSFGAGNAFASSLFSLSTVVLKNHIRKPDQRGSKVDENNPQLSALTADATDKIYYAGKPNSPMDQKYAVWLAPFGTYERIKKHDAFPTIRDRSIGALLGFDYNGWEEGMIGGGFAYAFQDVHYSQDLGKGKVNQELATIYGAWYGPYVTIEAALWGGLYQFRNYRKTLGFIESKSTIHGWLFAPHLAIEAPFKMSDSFLITPFVQFDWVNNWQGKVREHGKSGMNLRIGSHYASVLRSEVGLRLTQYKEGAYGTFKFEEGASYVNQAPFNAKKVSTYFVGSASTFDVQLFDDKVQNIGALYLGGWFIPNNLNIPEFGVNYQGEWGNILFSQTLSLEMTYRF